MRAEVKTLDAGAAGEIDLKDDVFGVEPRADILHRMVNWQLAKRRSGSQSTLTRSEVRGSRKKIYRQKGTGGARHGDKYAPQFRGGGIAHAPKPRSYAHDLTKKFRKLALRMALSAKARENALIVLDDARFEAGRTAALKEKLDGLGVSNALFVDGAAVDAGFARACRNLDGIDALPSIGANVYDILRRRTLVLTRAAVEQLEARLS